MFIFQINRMRGGGGGDNGSFSREDFNQRVMEINSLRSELDRIKKDKNLTSGLVTQMQRDMASKVKIKLSLHKIILKLDNIYKYLFGL